VSYDKQQLRNISMKDKQEFTNNYLKLHDDENSKQLSVSTHLI